jgi:hypothetical protein
MKLVAVLHLYVSVVSNTAMTVAGTSELGAKTGASNFFLRFQVCLNVTVNRFGIYIIMNLAKLSCHI